MVIAVACLPVITLGFGAALAHLLHAADTASDAEDASPLQATDGDAKPATGASPSPPAGLLEQARAIDAEHRLANRGKPISRDNLKLALGIATDKATALVHIIRAEHDPPAATGPGGQKTARDFPRAA